MTSSSHRKLFLVITIFIKGFSCVYDEESPTFLEEPPSRVEFINELGLRLNCSAKGRPSPSIRWTLADGGTLLEVPGLRYVSTSDGSLIFPPFQAEAFRPDVHSSSYRCIASNPVGTLVSRDVHLRAVVQENFETRVVQSGPGYLSFPTVLECALNPKYMKELVVVTSWVRDKSLNILPGSLDVDNKYTILPDGRLLIWEVSSQDAHSSFQCRVLQKLSGQTTVSQPGTLNAKALDVPSRPVISPRTLAVTVKENDRVVLPCLAFGLPKPSFRWYKKEGTRLIPVIDDSSFSPSNDRSSSSWGEDNNPISPHSFRLKDGTLVITSVKTVHKGIYHCNASNSEGSDVQEVEVIVRSPLIVTLHPGKVVVDLGKNAEFSCFISGEPAPGPVSWLKDGSPLRSGSGSGRIRFLGQNRLSITSVVREDQGIYQCLAKNDYETGQKAAQLILGDAYPQFIYRFIEQTLQPGPAISLKCSASGNPTPKVSWLLDGFPLPQSDRFLIGQYATAYGDVISHVNITSVRVEDGGEYECSFENRAGKGTHAARLNIYGPPHVRVMSDILATAGQKLVIKCPVGGYPIEPITWTRDEVKLPLSDRQTVSNINGSLSIEPIERSDAGTYTCSAENKQGSMSQGSVNVRVMVPPKITPFTFPTDLHEGERASVQCVVVKGDPPLTFTWLKDEAVLSGSSIQMMNINTNHEHGHQQQQQVHHTSTPNSHNSNQRLKHFWEHGKMSIRQIDHFSSVLSISSLEAGHSGNYTCQVKNGFDDGYQQLQQQPPHTAVYTAFLHVNVPPRISPFSFDDGLTEGMRTQVMCTTIAGDEPINITWLVINKMEKVKVPSSSSSSSSQVNLHQTSSANGIHVNYFSPFSTILTIPNITSSHSGNYTCQASNLVGSVGFTAQLSVTVPAKWVVEPEDQAVSVGSHVAIHCQAEGFPQPTIKWKQATGAPSKKEFREVGYRTFGIVPAENGSLIISRVTEDHEAHYLCLANNGVGPGLSKLIRLIVNAAPRIRNRPQKEMVRKGETIRMGCEAEGDEPIHISWRTKGTSLNETKDARFATVRDPGASGSGSPSTSELIIRDVSMEDRGDFECIATNEFGQDAFRISLLVQERPQVPENFRAVEKSSRTVLLSWTPLSPISEDEGNVLDYILWYKEGSEKWSEQTSKKSTSRDKSSLLVTGLSPAETYDFRLFARNQLGMSDATNVLQITTDGEAPGGPPLHFSVEAISSTDLRMSWQPPSKEYQNGQILGYNIGLRGIRDNKEGFEWTKIETVDDPSTVFSYSYSYLEKFTEYEVVSTAFNADGQGPRTQSFFVTTLEDVPSAAPVGVVCPSPTSHALSVNWQPPPKKESNGNIVSYKVVVDQVAEEDVASVWDRYRENASGLPYTELEARVNIPTSTFHGLSPYTNYSVQVSAATSVGEGIRSRPIFCRTMESVPDIPAEVKAVRSSAEAFTVSWLPPRNPRGKLTKYHLYLRLSEANSGKEVRTLRRSIPSSSTTTYHENIERSKRTAMAYSYEIWITAETTVGEGPQSPVIKFSETLSPVTSEGKFGAGIGSFGRWLAVPWKSDILLPCQATGFPKPILNWKRREMKIIDPSSTDGKYEIGGKDNALRIKSLQRGDSGNYSCTVRNPMGADSIVYTIAVQVPPTAPLLHPTLVSSSSVRLQWKQGDNGGSSIRGFVLNYREADEEWEEILLPKRLSTFEVQNLKCGQMYEFSLSAVNGIGTGEQSAPVKVTTRGSRPSVPSSGIQFMEFGPTSIRFNLIHWDAPECPASSFIIEYKVKGSSQASWTAVRHDLEGSSKRRGLVVDNKVVQINELTPETEYLIRIRAANGAGVSTGEYEISTSVFKGELRSSRKFNLNEPSSSSSSVEKGSSGGNKEGRGGVPFYQNLHVILPLFLTISVIAFASASVFLWLRKKRRAEGLMMIMESRNSSAFRPDHHHHLPSQGGGFGSGGDGGGGGVGGIHYMADRDYTVIRAKLMPDCDYIPESADDIYPYATFHLPEGKGGGGGLGQNMREGFLGPLTSQKLSIPETTSYRQAQLLAEGGQNRRAHRGYEETGGRKQRGSRGGGGGGSGESEVGESEEYDDSCGSDFEPALLSNSAVLMTTMTGGKGPTSSEREYYGELRSRNSNNLFSSSKDETLLISDRKSLPRGERSRYVYGYCADFNAAVNHPRGGHPTTMDRPRVFQEKVATTSFMFPPPSPLGRLNHQQQRIELPHLPLGNNCDNLKRRTSGSGDSESGKYNVGGASSDFIFSTPSKQHGHSTLKQNHPDHLLLHQQPPNVKNGPSDYTIAV